MAKIIIGLLFLAVLVLSAVLFVQKDAGFVMIKYGDFSLQTTLAFGIAVVVVGGLLIQIFIRFLLVLLRLPKTLAKRSEQRRFEKSRKLLNLGLIDLAEGRFEQAENNLLKLIDYAENPLINYLAAARAAQQLSKYDQRDNYLKAAHDVRPDAAIAIGVSQAELQLSSNQSERALATLSHLRTLVPKHDYVLKLLSKVYIKTQEWALLCELLPEIRKKKLFNEEELNELELKAFTGCLNESSLKDEDSLAKAWSKIPKLMQTQASLILHYIELVNRHSHDSKLIEQLIVKSINQQWNTELLDYYGRLASEDPTNQLTIAEKWLQDYGSSDILLLALGRICIRLKLWGKAQNYLEASIGIKASAESCLELADLLNREELNEPEKAGQYYRQGLQLCLRG